MMTSELLSHLSELNVMVRAHNGQLIVTGPKRALTSALRAELSERKAEILMFLSHRASSALTREPALQRVPRNGKLPLSFAQQRLWFLDQYEPNSSFYNIPNALRLRGPLDVAALEQSLNEIVCRHESLRTTFSMVEGEAVQVIAPSLEHSLAVVDLRDRAEGEREEEARRLVGEESRQPFDLAQGPLFRSQLLRLGEDNHVLLLTMHHIVSDGWSMGVLYRELSILYRAFVNGESCPLADLSIQYADFAVWQRKWLQGEVFDRELSYWKKQLEGIPGVLDLTADRPRPAVQSHRGRRQSIQLSRELAQGLKQLSRKEGVTPFMTLLAAFQTLLHRYSGQDDIVIGSPIANRNRAEIEGLIGFFVNTLVLRSNFSDNPTFRELLARVRRTTLEAYEHQDIPFEKLVEDLKPDRSISHSPLFQVMFVLQNAPTIPLQLDGLDIDHLRFDRETGKFDLTLSLHEVTEGLEGSLQYNTDLFDAATIQRMLGHFEVLLESIVANMQRRISDLPMLTKIEEHQLLVEWNDTRRDWPNEKCIHQLFEAQAERSPDAVAVIFGSQRLKYRELNTKANQLAHYLSKLGIGPDTLIGVCLERSLEMIIGLLGILKAGGAYVPLDPDYPKERLALMLADTRAPVLLTHERLRKVLSEADARVVCLDRDFKDIGREPEDNFASQVTTSNVAYVMYTSGSTGIPKGVMITHRALCNLINSLQAAFPLTCRDRVLQKTPFSFDASVWEFYAPLLVGATLVIARPGGHRDPAYLNTAIAEEKVTALKIVPSLLSALIDEVGIENSTTLQRVFCGGEELPVALQERFFSKINADLYNMYGPTEATIDATFWCCKRDKNGVTVPIGRPICNTQCYILSDRLQVVSIGVKGELYIGGDALARGYLNRPELTAEKFIPNPFSKEPGARLYMTGDLARYLPDGNIEFLGRVDHQVKVRGYRIELGEVESVLSQHPSVKETVVLAWDDVGNFKTEIGRAKLGKRLVAYVVPLDKHSVITRDLRSFLKQKLPEYIIPNVFVLLDALPLTPNGKINRRVLPLTEQSWPELEGSCVPPRDILELQLTRIWEKTLRTKYIGVRDNFFDCGGHSLLAVSLMAQIEKLTGKRLPLASLFQAQTIEDQAKLLCREGWSAPWRSLVAIQPGGSKPPLFCAHAHEGNVLFYRDLALRLGSDQPFYALQAQGVEGEQSPHTRIEQMGAHYITEIRTIQPEGPYLLGGYCFGGLVAFEMARQLEALDQQVSLVALFDSYAPGYQNLYPDGASVAYKASRLIEKIHYHLETLLKLGPKEKLSYVVARFKRIISKFNMAIGCESGRSRRDFLHAMRQARLSYHPQVYQGRLTLFRATRQPAGYDRDPQMGWGSLAAGGLEIHEIPGYCGSIVFEPNVWMLAEQLKVCLNRVHLAESGNSQHHAQVAQGN
jgi:aspartate racemase